MFHYEKVVRVKKKQFMKDSKFMRCSSNKSVPKWGVTVLIGLTRNKTRKAKHSIILHIQNISIAQMVDKSK